MGQFPQFPFSEIFQSFQPGGGEPPKEDGGDAKVKSPFPMWNVPSFGGFRMPELPQDGNSARERDREAEKEREERKERKRERKRVRDRDAKKKVDAKNKDEEKDKDKETEEFLE